MDKFQQVSSRKETVQTRVCFTVNQHSLLFNTDEVKLGILEHKGLVSY